MKLGLAYLTAIDLAPADLARVARRHGFDEIGLRLAPASTGGPAYPLPEGSSAAAAFRRVAEGEGIVVADIEFVSLTPEIVVADLASLQAAGAALGARSLTVSGDDPDPSRLASRFATLCDLAHGFGRRVDMEFMRFRATATLAMALAVILAAGRSNGSVLLDTLHFHRAGGDVAALGDMLAEMVWSVQISDSHAANPVSIADLVNEARTERLAPGDGVLPLVAMVRPFPDATVSVEAPNARSPIAERLQRANSGARQVLNQARAS